MFGRNEIGFTSFNCLKILRQLKEVNPKSKLFDEMDVAIMLLKLSVKAVVFENTSISLVSGQFSLSNVTRIPPYGIILPISKQFSFASIFLKNVG